MSTTTTLPAQRWLQHSSTQRLLAAFEGANVEIRFVGGCVRDALMGRIVKDVDACTPATPQQVIALLNNANIRSIPTGIAHGTVTALVDHISFEITTLRQDTACNGRHAEVAYTNDWAIDAARRDFTMNALYCDAQGAVTEYIKGGIEDAQAGRIRFIGDANDRIAEDALRILRFFRFYATHGSEPLAENELHACYAHADMLDQLSGERIQQEMLKLLSAPDPRAALQAMGPALLHRVLVQHTSLDILDHIIDAEAQLNVRPDPITRLAALIGQKEESAETILWIKERWKLSNQHANQLQLLQSHERLSSDALESTMKIYLRHLGKEMFEQLILLSWRKGEFQVLDVAHHLCKTWEVPVFPVNGKDLIALGYTTDKSMGDTLNRLEALWESMDYTMCKEQLLKTLNLH